MANNYCKSPVQLELNFHHCLHTTRWVQLILCLLGELFRLKWFVQYSKVDTTEFSCERSFTAAPASSGSGTEVTLDVTYEPIRLGECRGTLSVTSSIGGEYFFPLQGRCVPPKPQGPYVVRNKATTSIPFKNVFPTTTVFAFQVGPVFSCVVNMAIALLRPVVFNLFCSIAPLQELFLKIAPCLPFLGCLKIFFRFEHDIVLMKYKVAI